MDRHFGKLLEAQWAQNKFLCVGLDPDIDKIPTSVKTSDIGKTFSAFNRAIVDATKTVAGFYKPNPAFFELAGVEGWQALKDTIDYIRETAPEIPVILDAKRGDIGNTNIGYAKMAFDFFKADAVTVHSYQGGEALAPFFERADKGVFWLVRTSNPGAAEFQDLKVEGEELYKIVSRAVAEKWNKNRNCGVVVGTTYPDELKQVRALVGDMPILMPGTGAQGGDLEASVKAGKDSRNRGLIVNASRAVLYASSGSDFADAARVQAQAFDSEIRKALLQ